MNRQVRPKTISRCFLVLLISILVRINTAAQTADIILTNGKIFTSDTSKLYVQALAIKGNKIIASGTNGEILKLANNNTKKIDVKGKTVTPGFNDAHDHPGFVSASERSYSYTEMNPKGLSKSAVLDSIATLVKEAKPNQWISGLIGTEVFFDTSMRTALDNIAPNNPVLLRIWWGHGIVLNQKALEAAGLSDANNDPLGGWYIRNSSNQISAVQQNAQVPSWIAIAASEPENHIKGLQSFAQKQLKEGITTTQYMGSGLTAQTANEYFLKANLPQRIRIIAWQRTTANGRQVADWDIKHITSTPFFSISGVKYVIDGTSLEGNSLQKVSSLRPGQKNGRLNYPIDTLKQIFKEALTTHRQLMMHITGDSSFEVALSLLQQSASGDQWKSKRVRIEHNCVGGISPQQRKVLKAYNVLMMHTPKYCMGSPLRSLMEKGVIVGISPDGTTNPFLDIMMCTTMQSDSAENLTREQAVIAYTKNNAYAEFKEKEKGTLMPGMLADLVVLSQDIFTIPPKQLPATRSVLTMIDGKIAYQEAY
jgi:predicted amidohydrolase YtcJ